MNKYELVYAVAPNLDKENVEEFNNKVKSYIESNKGTVKSFNEWGLKKLAYPIKNYFEADYYFCEFSVAPEYIEELKNTVRLSSDCLRFSIIKIEKDFSVRKFKKKPFRRERKAFNPRGRTENNERFQAPKRTERTDKIQKSENIENAPKKEN